MVVVPCGSPTMMAMAATISTEPQSAQACPIEDVRKIDPRTIPVTTIPILIAPENKLKVVARELLSRMAALSADPNTGQAKPRTKLSNHDAKMVLREMIMLLEEENELFAVAVESWEDETVVAVIDEKAFHVMIPYATADVLSKSNSNP
mmetsp:Transcript_19276/g.28522  ORF Transcript_19276/g.28522 Transcript_19276/m.28522 type:complete len:149 (+) Transcript_19276:259-705(+)